MLDSLLDIRVVTEILILWVIFYAVIRYLKGTRAAGMLKGLVVLFFSTFILLMLAARQFNLENIRFILEQVLFFVGYAMVIIFWPELRRGLVEIGARIHIFPVDPASETVLKQIIVAVLRMSERRTGALIVIERENSLRAYASSGVAVDGLVKSELLETIFFRPSPLHDGAVIIRQDRIVAAHCILPMTDNVELATSVGTRHRAGIGITEEFDAIAVIVSEETGLISLTVGGQFEKGLNRDELEERLKELYFSAATGVLQSEEVQEEEGVPLDGSHRVPRSIAEGLTPGQGSGSLSGHALQGVPPLLGNDDDVEPVETE